MPAAAVVDDHQLAVLRAARRRRRSPCPPAAARTAVPARGGDVDARRDGRCARAAKPRRTVPVERPGEACGAGAGRWRRPASARRRDHRRDQQHLAGPERRSGSMPLAIAIVAPRHGIVVGDREAGLAAPRPCGGGCAGSPASGRCAACRAASARSPRRSARAAPSRGWRCRAASRRARRRARSPARDRLGRRPRSSSASAGEKASAPHRA